MRRTRRRSRTGTAMPQQDGGLAVGRRRRRTFPDSTTLYDAPTLARAACTAVENPGERTARWLP